MSPSGYLREYLRWHAKLSCLLLIPALIILPILGFILWQLAVWLNVLLTVVKTLVMIPVFVLLGVLATRLLIVVIRRK